MEVLLALLAQRYERKTIMITSNLVFAQRDRIVSGAVTPPGFQLEAGVKAQGVSSSMSKAGWPAAMASSVALR